MNDKNASLQDLFLASLRDEKIQVAIFLSNGIRLVGHIEAFDIYAVLLKAGGISQLVYKHAISTIMPGGPISLFDEEGKAGDS